LKDAVALKKRKQQKLWWTSQILTFQIFLSMKSEFQKQTKNRRIYYQQKMAAVKISIYYKKHLIRMGKLKAPRFLRTTMMTLVLHGQILNKNAELTS